MSDSIIQIKCNYFQLQSHVKNYLSSFSVNLLPFFGIINVLLTKTLETKMYNK